MGWSGMDRTGAGRHGAARERGMGRLAFVLGLVFGVAALAFGWWLAGREAATRDVTNEVPVSARHPAVGTTSPATPGGGGVGRGVDPATRQREAERAHRAAGLSADARRQIEAWRAAGGGDAAPVELALSLLEDENYYQAFEIANSILAEDPEHVDARYVVAAVRVRMGQPSQALPLLDAVLEAAPDHLEAGIMRGKALRKAGHEDLAAAQWRSALLLAGGSHPEIEALLRGEL